MAVQNNQPKKILFFSWPAVVFILLCLGVLLVGWTFFAVADDVHVSAKVSAPLPTGPATIVSPTDGQRFSAVPITVTGTCPSDGSGAYIKLFRNDFFSGSALCDASQRFSLSTDLFPGANRLKAVVFNKTDDAGPDSNTPTIYYDVPPSVVVNPTSPPLVVTTDFKYVGFYVGQTTKWKFSVSGGKTPYAINIDWGDGKNSVVSRSGAGEFTLEHKYDKPGGFKGSYKIIITGSDADGAQTSLQLFSLVNPINSNPIAGTTFSPPPLASTKNWLKLIWPAYLIVLLMVISYLLGEREEFLVLKKRGTLRGGRA